MNAKRYLMTIHNKRKAIAALERKMELLRSKADGTKAITYDRDKVQASPDKTMEKQVIELVDAERKYKALVESYHEDVLLRTAQITTMDNPYYAEILLLRYVEEHRGAQLSLDEIAARVHRSIDRVKHLHGEALAAFERQYLGG